MFYGVLCRYTFTIFIGFKVMWHFYGDVEVLSLCADCLRLAMTGNQQNCDSLLAIWTPAFPNERHHGQVEKGSWVAKWRSVAMAFDLWDLFGTDAAACCCHQYNYFILLYYFLGLQIGTLGSMMLANFRSLQIFLN